ncbi:hypothetical protein PSQ19_02810 [Devosia algicola]|uniref:ArsR family transcriptional regulator n=1 Tax=Devosia algicola TaxID=3026418 RepID=A0ABY7YPL4_9HYPH|nr:hypothetical protein [Devosia algicola]WDR03142.1 hypothetical protein PSQ19_02810 [Devosia algicola]
MKPMTDTILEGVKPSDFRDMQHISEGRLGALGVDVVDRLVANGWVQPVSGTYLITLTGRTLMDYPRGIRA